MERIDAKLSVFLYQDVLDVRQRCEFEIGLRSGSLCDVAECAAVQKGAKKKPAVLVAGYSRLAQPWDFEVGGVPSPPYSYYRKTGGSASHKAWCDSSGTCLNLKCNGPYLERSYESERLPRHGVRDVYVEL